MAVALLQICPELLLQLRSKVEVCPAVLRKKGL